MILKTEFTNIHISLVLKCDLKQIFDEPKVGILIFPDHCQIVLNPIF